MSKIGRYAKCHCGQSDGGDDVIDSYSVLDRSYNGSEMVVRETRRCDMCHKYYHVIMHYKLEYEGVEYNEV